MESKAQRKATAAYRKKNVKQLTVSLYPADADIIEWLETMSEKEGKAAYIRRIVREDIARNS